MTAVPGPRLDRWEWLSALAATIEDELLLGTYIGAPCFEWAALTGERPGNALVGVMGNTLAMACGLALAQPDREVVAIDGDGSVLLELGVLALLGQERPPNLSAWIVDNGCYESIGAGRAGFRPTAPGVDLAAVALACGIPEATTITTAADLAAALGPRPRAAGCRVLVVKTAPAPSRVPPRDVDMREDKYRFARHVERLSGRRVLRLTRQGRPG
jgi:thiamine pyrophosphate-dependent acetolactate synthase large subunit-like protein